MPAKEDDALSTSLRTNSRVLTWVYIQLKTERLFAGMNYNSGFLRSSGKKRMSAK